MTERFLRLYLAAWTFWSGLSIGCLGLLMLHHLVSGRWGFALQRRLEDGAGAVLPMAALFVPIAAGLPLVYPWARAAGPRVSPYLAPFPFRLRSAAFLACWCLLADALRRSSARTDRGEPRELRRLQGFCAAGLVVWALTATFAAVDWTMSLEAPWHSTVYGLEMLTGHALAALAFLAAIAPLGADDPLDDDARHDVGNLLLAFLMLWAYLTFSQLLILWSGNVPEEIRWYLRRLGPAWGAWPLPIFLLHFLLPFLLLLQRPLKRGAAALAAVAWTLLAMRLAYLAWLILPAFEPPSWRDLPMGLLAWALPGAAWVLSFRRLEARRA